MPNQYEQRPYRPERLPQAAERSLSEGSLRAALIVAGGVHRTSKAVALAEPATRDERWKISQLIRNWEEFALSEWAFNTNRWFDADEFTQRWIAGGKIEGAEHQVYLNRDVVVKRNNMTYHTTWLDYFHRLVLHNWLFPDTAIQFNGLMLVEHHLQPVITQKALLGVRGASRTEVEIEMARLDFYRRQGDDYYNPNLGILVEDLHDENVLVSPHGSLLIFDPVIYLAKPEMGLPTPTGFFD